MVKISKKLCFLLAFLSIIACQSKHDTSVQTQAVPPTTATTPPPPTPPSAPALAPAPQAPTLDGDWKGNSGNDLPLSFSVKNNQVSQLYVSYRTKIGSCSAFASFDSPATAPINGKSFTVKGMKDQMNDHIEFTMNGTFTSDKEASGTFHWTGKSNLCGPIDTQANWTAKKGPIGGSDSGADSHDGEND